MPFVANTPESLLARNDSKISSRTCRGITSNGKPCRRPISPPSTPTASRKKLAAVDLQNEGYYCWQHRDQAAHATPSPQSTPTKGSYSRPSLNSAPNHRSSLDTLTDRLNMLSVEEKRKKKKSSENHYATSAASALSPAHPPNSYFPAEERKPKSGFSFCCFNINLSLDDSLPQARPRPQPPQTSPMAQVAHRPTSSVPAQSPSSGGRRRRRSSQTGTYMKLIPPSLDPSTASALMAELAKGFTDAEEPGYIYMFWLTPDSEPAPTRDVARSLMEASSRSTPPSAAAARKKPLLLKIGRAANVQRRMNQWSRQCGHSVEILRFYPYIPSGSAAAPRMTPHVKKVERLIHLELTGMGMKAELDKCQACGKDHREWFQVKQSRETVAKVDEVIRRWVGWDEGQK